MLSERRRQRNGFMREASEAPMQGTEGLVRSVQRAMLLLSKFSSSQPSWAVSELARETGLHKSVVTRLMATMARGGFVIQDPVSRAYSIGPKVFAVGSSYRPEEVLGKITRPVMQRASALSGHATSLGVPAGARFIYLLVNEGMLPVRVAASIGEERDYHANAIGKVLLSGMTDAEVREIVGYARLVAHTPHTITSVDRLLEEIAEIRRAGIAYNRQEAVVGVGAVAAPVADATGRVVAALSIVYPIHLVDDEEIQALEKLVRDGGRAISASLGH